MQTHMGTSLIITIKEKRKRERCSDECGKRMLTFILLRSFPFYRVKS